MYVATVAVFFVAVRLHAAPINGTATAGVGNATVVVTTNGTSTTSTEDDTTYFDLSAPKKETILSRADFTRGRMLRKSVTEMASPQEYNETLFEGRIIVFSSLSHSDLQAI